MSRADNQLKFWLAFNQISGLGPIRWQRLLNYFPDLETAWQAKTGELIKAGLESKIAENITVESKKIDPEVELDKIKKLNIKVTTILDSSYPKPLKEIYGPPPLLYHYGNLNLENDFCLAVVGTRKISAYGKQITSEITKNLARAGLTIISGLALGVDALAHESCLQAGGKTIAVLGSGLDQIYPASNRQLAQKIIEQNGAIISEFPLGTKPFKSNFPLRNRIISGLSLGVLVTEAGLKSGALITTKYALDQNREVFAVPGNVYSQNSQGPNFLIKLGAKTVTVASDILEILNLQQAHNFKTALKIIPENETEKILLDLLDAEPLPVDKLVIQSKLNISVVNSTLSILEMKGYVKNLGGQTYIKAR